MWTPEDRALVGDFGSGQALTDDQFRLLEPLLPSAKIGGRPRTTDMRRLKARLRSHGAGSRLRLGWTRRWSIRRIAARVTIASETSGSAS